VKNSSWLARRIRGSCNVFLIVQLERLDTPKAPVLLIEQVRQ